MRVFVVYFAAAFIISEVVSAYVIKDLDSRWNEYKQDYKKTFISSEEERRHKKIFSDNLVLIEANNENYRRGQASNLFGIDGFTDIINLKTKILGSIPQLLKFKLDSIKQIPQTILGFSNILN
ncbi:hypothetical protein WA026_023250 [Henosepilachna vigintioctopunctata]|uniref:Cathepsin propeptide inhibitor domain-containing protein n=1 Tax=Henosepilachna vigintioctopunctata TaxID=420089 RepID=A0AAW1UXH1_9CUCU